MCQLEQRVKRVGAESGNSFDTHVDSELFALEPLADSREIVFVQECESVGLQGIIWDVRWTLFE